MGLEYHAGAVEKAGLTFEEFKDFLLTYFSIVPGTKEFVEPKVEGVATFSFENRFSES